jgi:hypothetical protein
VNRVLVFMLRRSFIRRGRVLHELGFRSIPKAEVLPPQVGADLNAVSVTLERAGSKSRDVVKMM